MTALVTHGLSDVAAAPSVVSIGFFDGVHRGHQSIIAQALRRARAADARCVAVTFDRHPMEVVRPGSHPLLLMTHQRRARTLAATGVDLVVVLPFDDQLRHSTPEEFVDLALAGPLQTRSVVVGTNFRFGHRAAGDVGTLAELGASRGFGAVGVTLLELDGVTVSSTAIRSAVADGDVALAARMLGRPHVLDGIVVRGDQRGAQLGFPTANLALGEWIAVPAPGVYAGRVRLPDDREADAVTNVGYRPTFGGDDEVHVEAHLIDADEDLYGAAVAVDFRHRIRGEQRFDGPDALIAQIRTDVAAARDLLSA